MHHFVVLESVTVTHTVTAVAVASKYLIHNIICSAPFFQFYLQIINKHSIYCNALDSHSLRLQNKRNETKLENLQQAKSIYLCAITKEQLLCLLHSAAEKQKNYLFVSPKNNKKCNYFC